MLAKFVVALVQLAIRIMGNSNSKAFKKAMEEAQGASRVQQRHCRTACASRMLLV